jgi:hypothetical protein
MILSSSTLMNIVSQCPMSLLFSVLTPQSNSSHLQLRIPEVKWWDTADKLCLKSWRLLRAHFKSWKLQHTLSLLCVQCRHLRHVITCRAKAMATRWKFHSS